MFSSLKAIHPSCVFRDRSHTQHHNIIWRQLWTNSKPINRKLSPDWLYRGPDKYLARPDWKNNWKVSIFSPTRRSLLPRRPGWTDNLNFFWVACKSQSLVAVACFLPGWTKDLSKHRYCSVVCDCTITKYMFRDSVSVLVSWCTWGVKSV